MEHFGERHKVADRKTEPSKTVAVMGVEPIPGWEPEDIQKWYSQHHNEAGLAKAFAAASNKFWCVEDLSLIHIYGQKKKPFSFTPAFLLPYGQEPAIAINRRPHAVIV